jgi:hypothetical protein
MFLIFLFSKCGTDQGEARKYDYSIINSSGVVIEIIPYSNGIKYNDRKIILNNNQLINKVETIYPPYGGGIRTISALFPNFRVNKIDIIFNGTKKVSYEDCSATNNCNAQPKNIFNHEFHDELTEVYTITPEDFEAAEDCGGNCN